jgi:hypothetical protein
MVLLDGALTVLPGRCGQRIELFARFTVDRAELEAARWGKLCASIRSVFLFLVTRNGRVHPRGPQTSEPLGQQQAP